MDVEQREAQRLELQAQLERSKQRRERNKAGQFATPATLAMDIVTSTRAWLEPETRLAFLDPAVGRGAFLSAFSRCFPHSQVHRAVGYEIDPSYACVAASLWEDIAVHIHVADFTRARPPQQDSEKFNLLICNPPYVRHQHPSKEEKRRLCIASARACGINASERCGLYCYFLWIAHDWLADDGLACWLVPGECMSVHYGQQVRDYLLNQVTLLRIHCFAPADVQFADSLVTSSVIWFKKSPPSPEHCVAFSSGGTLDAPGQVRTIARENLCQAKKWQALTMAAGAHVFIPHAGGGGERGGSQPLGRERGTPGLRPDMARCGYRLADLFEIKRGVATGSNGFFVLGPEQIAQYQLPAEFLFPLLPRARDLSGDEIQADTDGNPIVAKRVFLLACGLAEDVIKARYPSLWRYLQLGRARGIDRMYLCSHRRPWYLQEKRLAPLFVCSYMGRQRSASSSPFCFLLNHSRALATNSYHLLSPRTGLLEALRSDPGVLGELWERLKSLSVEDLLREGRTYGGGLHKMEPGELANVLLRDLPEVLRAALEAR
ncbi:MAG TPA: N-6 DNA methylase [Ktedonobacteraceae bacterium]|jgi:hypothetical protein